MTATPVDLFYKETDGTSTPVDFKYKTSATSGEEAALWFTGDNTPTASMTVKLVGTPGNPVTAGAVVSIPTQVTGGVAPFTFANSRTAGAPAAAFSTDGKNTRTLTVPVGTADGTQWSYTTTVTDSSTPPNTASDTYTIGVGSTPTQPDPLTAQITQTPKLTPAGTAVQLQVTPIQGGTAPYSYAWTLPAGLAVTGQGTATVKTTVPANAAVGTRYVFSCVVTDAGSPAQSVTVQATVTVGSSVRTFAGLKTKPRFGMRSDPNVWDTRWGQVQGSVLVNGVSKNRVTGKRIYADLDNSSNSQHGILKSDVTQIHLAIDEGLFPDISIKDRNIVAATTAPNQAALDAAQTCATWLKTLGVDLGVCYWHEPYNNFGKGANASMYVQKQKAYMPLFKHDRIVRHPILDGWLLDNQQDVFGKFCPDALFTGDYWECFGWDNYQAGTGLGATNRTWPGDKMQEGHDYLISRGYDDWPVLIGEYNAWIGDAIKDVADKAWTLKTSTGYPRFWMVCMWDSTTGKGVVLDSQYQRLPAFRDYTLGDSRIWSPANGDV